MPASSLPAWYTARSTEQASLNSLSSLITVRLNTESISIFDKSIQPSLVIQGCLPEDVILSFLSLHNIYLSNAPAELRALMPLLQAIRQLQAVVRLNLTYLMP